MGERVEAANALLFRVFGVFRGLQLLNLRNFRSRSVTPCRRLPAAVCGAPQFEAGSILSTHNAAAGSRWHGFMVPMRGLRAVAATHALERRALLGRSERTPQRRAMRCAPLRFMVRVLVTS